MPPYSVATAAMQTTPSFEYITVMTAMYSKEGSQNKENYLVPWSL
jgi:hypothetical protein